MIALPDAVADAIVRSERAYFAGRLGEAIAVLQPAQFADRSASVAVALQRAKLLVVGMFMEGAAAAPAREALAVAREHGDERQRATATAVEGLSHYYEQLPREQPDFSAAARLFQAALSARQGWGDSRELSESHFQLGLVDQFSGAAERAMEHFQRSLGLACEGGHPVEQSFAVRHIGFLQRAKGNLQGAYDSMAESLRLREGIGMTIYLPFSYISFGDAALALNKTDEAERSYARAKEIAGAIRSARALLLCELSLARLSRARERWDEARHSFVSARALAEQLGHKVALKEADEGLRDLPA